MFKSYPFSINFLGYTAIVMLSCSVVLAAVAIGLPYWERYEFDLGTQTTLTKQGLWTYCIDYTPETFNSTGDNSSMVDVCGNYGDLGTNGDLTPIRVTRAFAIIGAVLSVAALVFAVLATFPLKTTYRVHYVSCGLGVAAGVYLLIAFAVFVGKARLPGYDIDVCVSLDIVAWLTAWAGAGFMYFAVRVKIEEDK
ncbi:uncharacterized protein LOC127873920 [Dreissena polymorpha]|uniref:Uncharacterized protein n=1 Tax=Dreissena polymorpha TaxID=45954 RepID=A0A9D4MT92_DREPO|nr:uncharacterized protein LOC127873920 [Dreissena polymorpha]KAH3881509.1 hypothetical protein DPMN_005435 [Dreissena polymorpha]